ncbi:MAG: hypothetical protein F4082_00885, partial [Gammaproteobacteria bacterium]|nr:hypothetical protein [Gammaproteobacteria bacterium]
SDAFNDIQFGIVGDSAFEPDETLIATLKLINPPIGVQLGKDTATITIENDDSQKAVLSASFSINRKENRYDHNELDNGKNHKVPILLDVSQAVDKDGKRVPFPEIPVRLCVSNSGTAKYDKSQSPYKPTDADYRVMLDGNPLGIGTQCTDIVIPAGQNFSNRYGLFIFGDDWAEADETIITEISCAGQCPDGVELGSRRLTVNIIDNDGPATLSLNGPADANEGNTGSTDRLFKVALSSPVTAAITYDLCFSGNSTIDLSGASTIADGADYQPLSDGAPATSRCVRSNIPATTTSAAKSIGIRVRGDTTVERNETVTVSLNLVGQLPPGVARGAFSATHRIVNDETVVSFSASSSSLDEDDGAAAVTVGLSPAPTEDIMLHYAISGTAGEDEDFTLENSGTLTVRAGASEAFIEVVPVADSAVEADETVIFELKDSNGYVSGSAKRHVLTIANDDSATLSISAPDDAGEGNAGTTDRLFTISFSELVKKTVHYRVCFSSGTAVIDLTQADPIPVGADYQPLFTSDGALVPGTSRCLGGTHAGENAQVVVAPVGIRVKGDVGVEVDETVTATVSFVGAPPAGVSLGTDSATHTIVDDDRVIASIVAPPDNDEGNSGSTDRFFTVTLSKPTSNHVPLSVCFSGTAAIDLTQAAPIPAAADYQPLENGAAAGTRCVDGSVAANSVSQSVGIRVRGDADIERHETVVATLAFTETVPAGFAIDAHATTAAHRILDDDVAVSFAASSSQVLEGDRVHNVTLNIVPAAPADFTFDYTVDGTAVAGTDFTLADSGTISVKKGATEVTAAIMLIDNQKFESSKTLVLRLPDDVATAQVHEVKIINNDIGVTVDSMSRLESGSDSTSATDVTLTVRTPPEYPKFEYRLCFTGTATLDYDGSLNKDDDYQLVASNGVVVNRLTGTYSDARYPDPHLGCYPQNISRQNSWNLRVVDDDFLEPDETIIAAVTAAPNQPGGVPPANEWSIVSSPATHTILNDSGDLEQPNTPGELILTLQVPSSRYEGGDGEVTETANIKFSFSRSANERDQRNFYARVCVDETSNATRVKEKLDSYFPNTYLTKFSAGDDYGLIGEIDWPDQRLSPNCFTRLYFIGRPGSEFKQVSVAQIAIKG